MKKSYTLISLLVAGLLAAGIWRLELDFHGWEGLTWTGFFIGSSLSVFYFLRFG